MVSTDDENRTVVPIAFRYLNTDHVDSFFSTGGIQLASFESCRVHESTIYRDPGEGSGTIQIKQRDEQTGAI